MGHTTGLIHTENNAIAVEAGAGMRNAEFDDVADRDVVARLESQEGMLIVELDYLRFLR